MSILSPPRHRATEWASAVSGPALALLVLATFAACAYQFRAAVTAPPPDLPLRHSILQLGFAAWFAALGAYTGWRGRERGEARFLSAITCAMALLLALSIVPSGVAGAGRHAVLFVSVAAMYPLLFGFARRFPRFVDDASVRGLRGHRGRRGIKALDRTVGPIAGLLITRPWIPVLIGVVNGLFWYWKTQLPFTYRHNLIYVSTDAGSLWMAAVMLPVGVASLLLTLTPHWVGYRLAAGAERRKALWILLGFLFSIFWLGLWISLTWLSRLTGAAILIEALHLINYVFVPIFLLVGTLMPTIGVLYGGAFDLRPVLGRTTVYGALVLLLTFLFAGVEELAQSLLTARLGLPDMAATWIGAGAVALAIEPLRRKLDLWLARLVPTQGSGAPPAAGDPEPEAAPEILGRSS